MLVRSGVFGTKRIARHLWRMCLGLFIAARSFFFRPSNRPLRLLSSVGIGQYLLAVQHKLVFSTHPSPADFAALLALSGTLTKARNSIPSRGDIYPLSSWPW